MRVATRIVPLLCAALVHSQSSWALSPEKELDTKQNVPVQMRAVVEAETVFPAKTLITVPETKEGEAFTFMLEEPVWLVSLVRMSKYHHCARERNDWRRQAVTVATECSKSDDDKRQRTVAGFVIGITVTAAVIGTLSYAVGKRAGGVKTTP